MSGGWGAVYDELAPTYDTTTGGVGWQVNERVGQLLAPLGLAPERVLDLGAGTGQTASALRALYPDAGLTLVDPSVGMLAQARARLPDAELVEADASTFLRCSDHTWDLVSGIGFLELVPDLFEVLRRAASRLSPGGHLVVSHEPLLADDPVQSRPLSRISGGLEVRRHPVEEVERRATAYGLERVASCELVAFARTGVDGEAVYELVAWQRPVDRRSVDPAGRRPR